MVADARDSTLHIARSSKNSSRGLVTKVTKMEIYLKLCNAIRLFLGEISVRKAPQAEC